MKKIIKSYILELKYIIAELEFCNHIADFKGVEDSLDRLDIVLRDLREDATRKG